MSRQEKADDLFNHTCEHCEEFAVKHKCEIKDTCPVYGLYKMAKEKKHIIKADEWQIPPSPKPEMI
jgi:hypothetical protein